MDARLEAAYRAQVQRQEVEEQRTFGFRRQGDHLPLLLVRRFLINHLQIRGLAAESGAVIHDLAVNLSGCEVDETQDFPQMRAVFPRLPRTPIPFWRLGPFISHGAYWPQVTQVTTRAQVVDSECQIGA